MLHLCISVSGMLYFERTSGCIDRQGKANMWLFSRHHCKALQNLASVRLSGARGHASM